MELTLESAFSTGGIVGHTSYLLLVVSMVMRRMDLLRILVILSALAAISYDIIWLKDPVGVFWETLLVLVNIVQLVITWHQNRTAWFSREESAFMQEHLAALSLADQRKFLNQGMWISADEDTELTRQGEPVQWLIYLASGRALVLSNDCAVAECEEGSFIGEMTALQGEPANATVKLSTRSRYWAIDAGNLRQLVRKYPAIYAALEGSFSRNLRDKLVKSNNFIVESGGVRHPSLN